MRKILFLLLAVLSIGLISYASTSEPKMDNPEVPQVCQFSVSPSAGKIYKYNNDTGFTKNFTVSVSCLQKTAKTATVRVYVGEVCIGSKVVTVPANNWSAAETNIKVSAEYADKNYILTVE